MKYMTFITAVMLVFIGCDINNNEYSARESELNALIDSDEALGLEGLDDKGADYGYAGYSVGLEAYGKGYLGKVMDDFHPDSGYTYHFGRKINQITKTVTYTHEEDYSLADIIRTVSADFIVTITDSLGNETTFEKPYTSDFQRSVKFVTENDHWKVDEFTFCIGKAGSKVDITKLEYYTMDADSNWVSQFVMEGDVLNNWITGDDVPSFAGRQPVKIEVTVTNSDDPNPYPFKSGEGVNFHRGRHRNLKARRPMNDEGIFEDAVAGDNIFTQVWLVHGPGMGHQHRAFRGFFSVIDFATIFDSDEDVNVAVWAMPYKVERP